MNSSDGGVGSSSTLGATAGLTTLGDLGGGAETPAGIPFAERSARAGEDTVLEEV